MYYDVAPELVSDWWNDPGYSHGFIAVPLALYLLWSQRASLQAEPARADGRGIALTVLGCGLYVAGKLGAEFFLTRVSFLAVIAGIAWTFWGKPRLRFFLLPLALLLVSIPIPALLYNQVVGPLQILASGLSVNLLQAAAIPIHREGNVIHLADMSLQVAEACSGLRSASSLAVVSLILGFMTGLSTWKRLLLVLASVPIALGVNITRICGTAVLVERIDPQWALGFYHSFSGWIIFPLGLGILWLTAGLLHRVPQRRRHETQP
jgi:exosortase